MSKKNAKRMREEERIKKGRKKKETVRKDGASYIEKKMMKELKNASKRR